MLHVISLAQYATAYTRGWAADSANARVRLKARAERLEQEVACLREEMRIKDARMASMTPHKRPHYAPTERLAILELRAARCWTLQQTADAFQVTPATIASWMKRVDEQGPDALLQMREPVNRFPDFVRQAIRDLKNLCPPQHHDRDTNRTFRWSLSDTVSAPPFRLLQVGVSCRNGNRCPSLMATVVRSRPEV